MGAVCLQCGYSVFTARVQCGYTVLTSVMHVPMQCGCNVGVFARAVDLLFLVPNQLGVVRAVKEGVRIKWIREILRRRNDDR